MLLYNWLSAIYCIPGPDNSIRIRTENAVPINPENTANIKYNVPISLALDERNHLSFHIVIWVILFNSPDLEVSSSAELASFTVEKDLKISCIYLQDICFNVEHIKISIFILILHNVYY